jgi:hypothetical protein
MISGDSLNRLKESAERVAADQAREAPATVTASCLINALRIERGERIGVRRPCGRGGPRGPSNKHTFVLVEMINTAGALRRGMAGIEPMPSKP